MNKVELFVQQPNPPHQLWLFIFMQGVLTMRILARSTASWAPTPGPAPSAACVTTATLALTMDVIIPGKIQETIFYSLYLQNYLAVPFLHNFYL